MNRNEAIEQAAQAVVNWNSDSSVNSAVVMDALRDALAMPKDAEPVDPPSCPVCESTMFYKKCSDCGFEKPQADAERVALLGRIDNTIQAIEFGGIPSRELMRDIRAYLQGGA